MQSADDDVQGRLLDHLIELRVRLLRAVIGLLIVFVALLPLANRLYGWLAQPLLEKLPKGGQLIAIEVASPFFAPLKLAFFVALIAAMPWLLYQAWAFVAPGLYRREKKLALPLLGSSLLLFYAGCAFAYFIVLPSVFAFLAKVTPAGVAMMTDINAYLDFVLVLFLAFGAAFETPIATFMLIWSGIVSPKTLKEIRPYVFLGAFVVGMLLAPDVFSMTLLAIPMYLLYEAGLFLSRIILPDKTAAKEAET